MKSRIRVLIDGTPLIVGGRGTIFRTGVYRVASELVHGLNRSDECHVEIGCLPDRKNSSDDYRYLADHGLLNPASGYKLSRYCEQVAGDWDNWSRRQHLLWRFPRISPRLAAWIRNRYEHMPIISDRTMNHFDVVHSAFYPLSSRPAGATCVRVLTVYDLAFRVYPDFHTEGTVGLMNRVLASIDKDVWCCAISEATKKDLIEYAPGVNPNRITVIPLAASVVFSPCHDDVLKQQVRSRYGLKTDAPYLLSVCTLEPRKNLQGVLRAYARLIEAGQDKGVNLVLVGGWGWLYDDLKKTLQDNPIYRDRVTLTGFVDEKDLAPLYSGALGFIYVSWYEGFGLPLLEAMQCGVPVISSNTSSMPEVVGDAGLMVDPSDVERISHAMQELIDKPELRADLARRGIERSRQFSWARFGEQTIDVYRRAIQGSREEDGSLGRAKHM